VVGAMASARLGQRDQAVKFYEKALPLLDPGSKMYHSIKAAVDKAKGGGG